jgi:transcriptional regulator with XRE-family HTH domain
VTPLAALLARIGWTPTELATRLEVLPGTAQQWARGRRDPPPIILDRLELVARAVEGAWDATDAWGWVRGGRRPG